MADSAELASLKGRLTAARQVKAEAWLKECALREELAVAENESKRSIVAVGHLERAVHALEGAESNCDHAFVAEPSGRGIGFDERCRRCGYFKNLYPVF